MPDTILYVDCSEIREGKLSKVKDAMKELAEFVETNEPQLSTYEFYISDEEKRMTVVAVHPDTASLEFHMQVAGEAFRKFSDLIDLSRIDVYGMPSELALNQLREKARMLGNGVVTVHRRHAGFIRYERTLSMNKR